MTPFLFYFFSNSKFSYQGFIWAKILSNMIISLFSYHLNLRRFEIFQNDKSCNSNFGFCWYFTKKRKYRVIFEMQKLKLFKLRMFLFTIILRWDFLEWSLWKFLPREHFKNIHFGYERKMRKNTFLFCIFSKFYKASLIKFLRIFYFVNVKMTLKNDKMNKYCPLRQSLGSWKGQKEYT